MPRVRIQPTIAVFEWANTLHALGRAATAIGINTRIRSINKTGQVQCVREYTQLQQAFSAPLHSQCSQMFRTASAKSLRTFNANSIIIALITLVTVVTMDIC
jgi:hypothetical protein